jgi:3-hydroxyisobutyrate dehydrogenase-like beta-hydroxyacid dehydrogenase
LTQPVIGFIGLGRMGHPMAGRLADGGYRLVVADTSAAAREALVRRGATPVATPRAVADAADLVFASLPTPAVVRQVALGDDGSVHGARMKLFVDLSTTGPMVAGEVARGIAQAGRADVLDCPVSGGVAGAAKGTLTLMAAGSAAALELAAPVLQHFGRLQPCGATPGHGQMVKVINNLLSVAAMAAASEAAVLAERSGLDPRLLFDVVNVSSGASNASQTKIPKHILPRTYDFGFATALSQKDVRLCLEQAEALGVPMLMGSLARQILTMTAARFGGDADFTMMHKLLEQLAGAPAGKE